MTPKEKALDLVNKFDGIGLQMRNEAIACALIAIDEIMKAIDWHEFETPNEVFNYWNRVKLEIQRL